MQDYVPPKVLLERENELRKKTILQGIVEADLPLVQLDYKWVPGSPFYNPYGVRFLAAIKVMGQALKQGHENLHTQLEFSKFWEPIRSLFLDIQANGVQDPLIVWKAYPSKYLVLKGNQRLIIAHALNIKTLACTILKNWKDENLYLKYLTLKN